MGPVLRVFNDSSIDGLLSLLRENEVQDPAEKKVLAATVWFLSLVKDVFAMANGRHGVFSLPLQPSHKDRLNRSLELFDTFAEVMQGMLIPKGTFCCSP